MPFPAYEDFLGCFLEAGYICAPMDAGVPEKDNTLFVRHDIDFDVAYAHSLARREADIGVNSTYYFMLTSNSYNLLSAENVARVRDIAGMGHKISVHFDPIAYEDFVQGLDSEVKMFERAFKTQVDIISIHRPNEFFLSHNSEICGVAHTYQDKYCKDTFYCSDSQGRWRFGDPRESAAFAERRSIQLLIHPIWWIRPEAEPQAKLDGYVNERIDRFIRHIEDNCKSFSAAQSIHRQESVR